MYREVVINYVDEINPTDFVKQGLSAMLDTLDPYTMLLSGSSNEIDLLMTGSYGGVGISVIKNNGHIEISDILEGYSAYREGLRIGDIIIGVDSVNIESFSDLNETVRGLAGTTVQFIIKRNGIDQPLTFNLQREKIELKNVTVTQIIESDIGYIKLSRFNKNAANEVQSALMELLSKGINSVILDLRGNPGGRLDEAINVSKKFLGREELIVSTKGRTEESKESFFSDELPILPNQPLVVLIDSLSASASEIVAGAIQDQDRGTIIGQRSYGKGLVQTIIPVADDQHLKITTARYYTPSGRSIQRIDYGDMSTEFDTTLSLNGTDTIFKTKKGRVVNKANGIQPDIIIPSNSTPPMVQSLVNLNLDLEFTDQYLIEHQLTITTDFKITDEIFESFIDFIESKNLHQYSEVVSLFDEIQNSFSSQSEYQAFTTSVVQTRQLFIKGLYSELRLYRPQIESLLLHRFLATSLSPNDVFFQTYSSDQVIKRAILKLKTGS